MPQLHVLKGPNEGSLLALDGERFVLGRGPDCQVVIPVTSVSREHAQILRIGGKFFIEDKQSRNGTFVNNQQIGARTALKNNDRIRICDFIAAFLDGSRDAAGHDEWDEDEDAPESAHSGVFAPAPQIRTEDPPAPADEKWLLSECKLLAGILARGHFLCDFGGQHYDLFRAALTTPTSAAHAVLAEGFHRLVCFDASRAQPGGVFNTEDFYRHAVERLASAFDLSLTGAEPEDVFQILRDEPRSLLCFLEAECISPEGLYRIRSFTQDRHAALLIGRTAPPPTSHQEMPRDVLHAQRPDRLRSLVELAGSLLQTLQIESLLPQIPIGSLAPFAQADRCFLVLSDGEKLLPRIVKTRRPADEANARFSKSIVRKCLEEAKAFLSDDASRDDRIQLSQSVVDFRIRSVMCAPLTHADGKAFGVIQLDTQDRSKKFTLEDLAYLCGIANLAAVALRNARLLEDAVKQERLQRDLALAKQIHAAFLPTKPPVVEGYESFACCEMADNTGGDYHGFIPLNDGRICVAVGDVAGKGIDASLLMAKLSSDVRVCLLSEPTPAIAFGKLNDLLYEFTSPLDRFVTLAGVVLDPATHEAVMVSAGHDSPLLYRGATGELSDAMPRDVAGVPLGIMEGYPFESCKITLQPGDCLLLFTDGVTESKNVRDEDFGKEGILQLFRGVPNLGAQDLGLRLVAAVKRHAAGRDPHDDFTVVALGRR